ncbi:MAG: branched-chain amino acid ABC transporter permease [Tractidigestivibacter sp.]|uniref:branched-chain amino acid ABC transporter permease n=1 Tax=Tractidigestivibacter sp. TaxID=2847320 RepID=UPI003D9356C1
MTASNAKKATAQASAPAASGYRSLSMPMRYLINTVLVVIFLVVGEAAIDGGLVSRYQTGVIEQIGIYIIMAVSLNIATGYLGQLPLGHAGFMSVGGYSCAIFIMRMMDVVGVTARDFTTGTPAAVMLFVAGLIFGGIMAALCGLIIGIPALRLKGDYLAIITLGFAEIIRVVMQNIDSVLGFELTGGQKGLTGIPSYTNFLNTFIVVAICLFLIHTMMKSRHGRAILSIRDNEIAAESCGVNITYYKTLAFVVSAFFAGVAGGLYAGCIGVMAPSKFGFMKSVEILVMVVLGGMGSMLGSVISATVLTILPEALRAVADYRMVVYAVVLILVMIFRPEGLMGSYDFSMSRVIERLLNHGKSYEEYLDEQNAALENGGAVAVEAAAADAGPSKGGDA